MNNLNKENKITIFTNGAFLRPLKFTDNNGNESWLWTVTEFVDSSFLDGKEYNPPESALTINDLLLEQN